MGTEPQPTDMLALSGGSPSLNSSQFTNMALCTVGKGSSVMFWHDRWGPVSLKLQFPHLFSLAKDDLLSIKEASDSNTFQELFHLPLPNLAFARFHQARACLEQTNLKGSDDQWKYIWNSATFSPSKAYNFLIKGGRLIQFLGRSSLLLLC